MAAKKMMNRSAILNQLNTTGAMAQSEMLPEDKKTEKAEADMKKYIEDTNKKMEMLPIDELDPAPKEWNFFPALNHEKFQQLKMSLMNNGVLTPLLVWRRDNNRYMILSGHNRVEAHREILREYSDISLKRDYHHVPVIIYDKDEIDDRKAQEIIIDTNYIQRGQFDPKLRVMIVQRRMELMKTQVDEKGRRIDQIEQDLGIKKSAIYEDLQIGEKIIPELQELYYSRKINRKAVLKFVYFMEPVQKELYKKYGDKMTTKNVSKLKKNMNMDEEFEKIFNTSPEDEVLTKQVKFDIPEEYYDEFMKMYNEFASGKWE